MMDNNIPPPTHNRPAQAGRFFHARKENEMKINVLGRDYELSLCKPADDFRLRDYGGYMDSTSGRIVVASDFINPGDPMNLEDFDVQMKS